MTSQLHKGGQRLVNVRRQVLDLYGPWCGRCGRWIDLTLSGLQPDGLTVGHIVPADQGGSDALSNLRPEHRRCNLAAGARLDPPAALIAAPVEIV